MSKININILSNALSKVSKMETTEKVTLFDEIFNSQPNLLASVVVLQQLGNEPEQIEILLNILLVAHVALKEGNISIHPISIETQEKEMARLVSHIKFASNKTGGFDILAIDQYINSHQEKPLLSFAFNEMINAGFTRLKNENSKFLLLSGINIVNCIASSKAA